MQLPVINGYQQVMSVLKSLFIFVLPSNPFYLKSQKVFGEGNAMVDEDTILNCKGVAWFD